MNFEKDIYTLVKAGTKSFMLFSKPKTAYLYFADRRVNLINGKEEAFSLEDLDQHLKQIDLKKNHKKRILHFYYEWGVMFKNLPVSMESPLLIDIEYQERRKFLMAELPAFSTVTLSFARAMSEKVYAKDFKRIQNELKAGNCYQVNYTHEFAYHYKAESLLSFFKIWSDPKKRGAFAHATNIPTFSTLILSNSPECLWKMKGEKLYSYPIKGTKKFSADTRVEAQKELLASEKELGELNMITDLMRNDLAYLSKGISYVLKQREILEVPGLIHSYSVIMTKVKESLSLFQMMEALFPGGSVTGAPKKRVMQIIHELENHPRGMYCGSTVVLDGNVKAASINIRTATIDTQEKMFYYGAGGGITLLSKEKEEYQEMLSKITSFLQLLN